MTRRRRGAVARDRIRRDEGIGAAHAADQRGGARLQTDIHTVASGASRYEVVGSRVKRDRMSVGGEDRGFGVAVALCPSRAAAPQTSVVVSARRSRTNTSDLPL